MAGLIEFQPRGAPDDAQRVMDALAAGEIPRGQTSWHCCLEFYSVSTRLPEEYRLSPADALVLLEEEILGRLEVHALPEARRLTLLGECVANRVLGGRVYDVHIGAVALGAGARIVVTENRRHFAFLTGHGVQVMSAQEFVAQLS